MIYRTVGSAHIYRAYGTLFKTWFIFNGLNPLLQNISSLRLFLFHFHPLTTHPTTNGMVIHCFAIYTGPEKFT